MTLAQNAKRIKTIQKWYKRALEDREKHGSIKTGCGWWWTPHYSTNLKTWSPMCQEHYITGPCFVNRSACADAIAEVGDDKDALVQEL